MGRWRKAWGLASPRLSLGPAAFAVPPQPPPRGWAGFRSPTASVPHGTGLGPLPAPPPPPGTFPPCRSLCLANQGGKAGFWGARRKAALHPCTIQTAPQFSRLCPPSLSQWGVPCTLLAPRCKLGMCHPSPMGARLPSSPSPSRRTWGMLQSPPWDVGTPHAAAAVPHSPTFRQRRRRRTVCAAALPPGKCGQVDGAMAGGQEPGDEWEPGPAPSGSRQNAGAAKPGAGSTATTRPPWGKASHGGWET